MPDPKKKFEVKRKGNAYKTKQKPISQSKPSPKKKEPKIKTVELDEVTVTAKKKSVPKKKPSPARKKLLKIGHWAASGTKEVKGNSTPKAKALTKKKESKEVSKKTKKLAEIRSKGQEATKAGKLGKARRLARKYNRNK